MFGLSTLWIRVIGVAVILGALLFGVQRIYQAGYNARDTEAKLELSQALRHAAKQTDEIQVAFATLKAKQTKERKHAEQEISRLRIAVDDGTLRLSIPAAPQPGAADPRAGDPAPRTELDRATSQALVAITADGDAAIRDLNECVAKYNEVKEKLNGNRTD